MSNKKTKTLVQITEEEFIKLILDNIDITEDNLYEIQKKQNEFIRLYRNYNMDKQKYDLKFFIEDNILNYQKFKKPSIGFKQKNNKYD